MPCLLRGGALLLLGVAVWLFFQSSLLLAMLAGVVAFCLAAIWRMVYSDHPLLYPWEDD